MESSKVDMFMMMNSKYFEGHQLGLIREKLEGLDESKSNLIHSMQFKDPTTALIISIFGGAYGIDRFYIGDTGLGIAKLLTCGGFVVWTIVDWFLIQGLTREKNMEAFHNYLY
ncbi:MAG: TM2 domain-containing protein [Flavobacterium sp.]|jgi:TM2 domain-containing membrane protein YozV